MTDQTTPLRDRSVNEITLSEMVVRNARNHEQVDRPRWHVVGLVFALGSSFAAELCRMHGLDPDENVPAHQCAQCEAYRWENEDLQGKTS